MKKNLSTRAIVLFMVIELVVMGATTIGFITWIHENLDSQMKLAIVGLTVIDTLGFFCTLVNLVHYHHTGRLEDII